MKQRREQMSSMRAENNLELDDIDMQRLLEETRKMKRTLKQLSKNQLIQLLVEQVNINIEHQNINRVLLEKMKEVSDVK
jgi:hypothetical protein